MTNQSTMITIVTPANASRIIEGTCARRTPPKQQQQQPSHLSQVFGVGYMNQKRITPDRTHGSIFSTHSYRAICLH